MSAQWYLHKQGQRYGPYSFEQLCAYAKAGQCAPEDLVWSEGMADWVKASSVEGLFPAASPPPLAAPPAAPSGPPAAAVSPPGFTAPPSQGQFHGGMAQAQHTQAAGGERIVGMIPGVSLKTGMLKEKYYNLVLTDRRIIFAEETAQMTRQAMQEVAAEAKAQGKGFFARAADSIRSRERIYTRYWQMAGEAILAETAGNFPLWFNEIQSIKVHTAGGLKIGPFAQNRAARQQESQREEIDINAAGTRYKLFVQLGKAKEAKQQLQGVLGDLVR